MSSLNFPRPQETNISEYDKNLNIEGIINYDFSLKDAHHFNAEVGYAYRNHRAEFLQGQGNKPYKYIVFRREDSDTAILNNSINSVFASLDYNFKQRYYFYGGIRYDALSPSIVRKGTLLSSPENLEGVYVLYPSISLGWKLSNEAFLTNVSWLSNLMIRGGYGEAGKENNLYTLDNNKNLDFERSKEYNIMLDYGFLDNRIFGNLTYYQRTSYNVYTPLQVPVPPNLFSYVHDNSVEIANSGFELNISSLVISKPGFSYLTGFNFSSSKNEVIVYPQNAPERYNYIPSYLYPEDSYIQQIKQGEPLFTFYLPQFYGFADNGVMLFERKDGGITNNVFDAQRNIQGVVLPSLEVGWSNNFTFYSNFNFSFSLRYINGHSIYNEAKMNLEVWQVPFLNALSSSINEDMFYPKVADYYLENASYLRLDNIVFSYTLNLSKNKPEQKLKLQIGANNLFTITNYNGLDPEINYETRYPGIEKANVYPPIRSYFFGLNLSI
jgi:iron complex outermembrane receptor protein